jgi:hypothetical protein
MEFHVILEIDIDAEGAHRNTANAFHRTPSHVRGLIEAGQHPAYRQEGANAWRLRGDSDVKSAGLLRLTPVAGS